MLPQVILLSTPTVNLNAFAKAFEGAIGVHPFRGTDSHSRTFTESALFIAALAALQGRADPLQALREAVHELNHLWYSFLVLGDLELIAEISGRSDLKVASFRVLDESRLAIVSGSLSEWYVATLEFCSEKATFNLRHLFDQILLQFDKFGLSEVWHEKRRRGLKDKTFLLEQKI